MLETDLSEPISLWLINLGYTPYTEVPVPYCARRVDFIARKNSELLAIELKQTLTKAVIHQAYICDLITPLRYAAVGTLPRPAGIKRCSELGIGLLSVINQQVSVILEPEIRHSIRRDRNHHPSSIHNLLDRTTPHGIAGRPCLKGEGPAQSCFNKVTEYRKQHPRASWKQIFAAVPNHYANEKSLASSMSTVAADRGESTTTHAPWLFDIRDL
jgi:hypothetical protein